jgi:hypothetical protein
MLKFLLLSFFATVLVNCSSEEEGEGEIGYSFDKPCTFRGSWYLEGKGVSTSQQVAQSGSGAVKVYEDDGVCYVNLQFTTPLTSFCGRSVLNNHYSNYMYFDSFDLPNGALLEGSIYLLGEDRIAVQFNWNPALCDEERVIGFSVPGEEASDILRFCANRQNYFECFTSP